MKILIFTEGFFPGKKYGGPPVSVDNFCSLLKDNMDCFIVTRNHDLGENSPYNGIHSGWNERDNAKVMYLSDSLFCTSYFEKIINDVKPDYIYLQSLFQACIFPCLLLAKKYNIKVVLAPRGELCEGAFKKKYKKIPYIILLRLLKLLRTVIFQSTSDEETLAIRKYLGASSEKIYLLTNIPSIPHGLTERGKKISGKGRIVFISRILWKKNLLSAIKYLKGVTGDVTFDIYGPKEDLKYWYECENAIKELPSNVVVKYKGVLSHDDIHKTFNQYDAFLFPTLSENYGHVIAEALVSGCLPIISDQTPWNDINVAGAGWAIPLTEESFFSAAIQQVVDMNNEEACARRIAISTYIEKKMKISDLKSNYLMTFSL